MHLCLQIRLCNVEHLGSHLSKHLVDVVVGARLVDREPAFVIDVVVAAQIWVPVCSI